MFYNAEKQGIEHLNVPNAKEGQIKEQKARVAHVDEDVRSSHFDDVERGEVLDNRRVLLSGENEPEQIRSLFQTRCRCEDKFCDVIIDGGSGAGAP